ncbi:hypothetical protein [Actinokineospora enzanensis]|uniref:hypothetical protein n=1 Tax=Actinokineospora enzanensis TaxID=155975 RepID=UPI0003A5C23A
MRPPLLTGIRNEHIEKFAADDRLFRGLDGGLIAESTAARVLDKARKAALTEEEYRSPLAKRPYDLRHAFVSTCLMAGFRHGRSRNGWALGVGAVADLRAGHRWNGRPGP